MPQPKTDFVSLYNKNLDDLINQLNTLPKNLLWQIKPGVINSCGVFVQHIIGNLNHYIGAQLGQTGYQRNRELEFQQTDRTKDQLADELQAVKQTVTQVLSALDAEKLDQPYPDEFPFDYTVEEAIIHLFGHLNYHLGQFNYLHRILAKKE